MTFEPTPAMITVDAAFRAQGFSLWLVGGAVRDIALNVEPKDFDFATDATPDEQIDVYEAAGLRYVPTGIQHGTISVVLGEEVFEITTLRTESEHDGRYATMTFTRDINEDLSRRDLTINAMAMTFDGAIIDPFGGMDDLKVRRVRFVGSADDRMREDYLRILRWVRFHQRMANGQPFDDATVQAARRNARGLTGISVERVWMEMSKALVYDNPVQMISMLHSTGIADAIGLPAGNFTALEIAAEQTRDPVSRLTSYLPRQQSVALAERWKMSGAEIQQAQNMARAQMTVTTVEAGMRRIAVEGINPYFVAEALRVQGIENDLDNWVVPDFPVDGRMLMQQGVKPGRQMGEMISQMRRLWADNDYEMSADKLIRSVVPD